MRILEGGRQAVLIGDLLVLYLSIDTIKEGGGGCTVCTSIDSK